MSLEKLKIENMFYKGYSSTLPFSKIGLNYRVVEIDILISVQKRLKTAQISNIFNFHRYTV